jgi:hypothetical protein
LLWSYHFTAGGILQCPLNRLQEEKRKILQKFYNVKTPHDPRLERLVPDIYKNETENADGNARVETAASAVPVRRSSTGIFLNARSKAAAGSKLISAGLPEM